MRTSALMTLVALSLTAMMVGCEASENAGNNGNVNEHSDTNGNGGDNNNDDDGPLIESVAPMAADHVIESDDIDVPCTDTEICEYQPPHPADEGWHYHITLNMPGYLTVTQNVKILDPADQFTVDFTTEGSHGVEFDEICEDQHGNVENLYTTIVEDENGVQHVILDGTSASPNLIVTDTVLSGSKGDVMFSGDIDIDSMTINIIFDIDGEITERNYICE